MKCVYSLNLALLIPYGRSLGKLEKYNLEIASPGLGFYDWGGCYMTLNLRELHCNTPWTTLRNLPVLLWHISGNDQSPMRVYNLLLNQSNNAFQNPTVFDKNSSLTLRSPVWGDSLNLLCHGTISPSPVSSRFSFDLLALLAWLFQYGGAVMVSFSSPSLFRAFFL